jgi:hypothetical protein
MPKILDGTISTGTSSQGLRLAIVNAMFAINLSQDEYNSRCNGLDVYFSEWYEDQCELSARQTSVATHQQIMDVIAFLRDKQQDQERQGTRPRDYHGESISTKGYGNIRKEKNRCISDFCCAAVFDDLDWRN